MESTRLKKVEEAYRHEVTQLLLFKVQDPRLAVVRVTHVNFTPDMRLARVYYDVSGSEEQKKEALKGLKRCKGFLKRELSSRIQLRFMPDLEFHYDESAEMSQKVEELFHRLDQEKSQK